MVGSTRVGVRCGIEQTASTREGTNMDAWDDDSAYVGPEITKTALARIKTSLVRPWLVAIVFWITVWPAVILLFVGIRPVKAVQDGGDRDAAKNLSCDSLTIGGAKGQPSIVLQSTPRGANMVFRDAQNRSRMGLWLIEGSQPHIELYDKTFHNRLSLGLDQNETPTIHVYDQQNKNRMAVWLTDAGGPHLQLNEDTGENSMDIRVSDKGLPAIDLTGKKTKVGLRVEVVEIKNDENPSISFTDGAGKTAMNAWTGKGGPRVTLFQNDAVRAQLAILSGVPRFSMGDQNSNPVFMLKVDEHGTPVTWGIGPKVEGQR